MTCQTPTINTPILENPPANPLQRSPAIRRQAAEHEDRLRQGQVATTDLHRDLWVGP
ncbi:MAG: hypothetical protein HY916_10195 [Desulfovibrio sp.]|nr:hypothetical protein [Desulfovibrio sp.]